MAREPGRISTWTVEFGTLCGGSELRADSMEALRWIGVSNRLGGY
jgi:hypothetical protein